MNAISSWSIRNPVPTVVLFVILALAGTYSYFQLRINNMPDIDLPTVTVSVAQPGAAPSELQIQVTQVIENALASIDDVEDVSSTVNEGSSTTTVEFTLGTDSERAANDVRNAVSTVENSLPAGAQTPVVSRVSATGEAILTFVIESQAKSLEELSWFVDNEVGKALLAAGDVSKVERSGGVNRAIRVKLDPDRLAALGITVADVSQALATVNVNQPGGRTTVGGQEQTVRTLASVETVQGLADTRIALTPAGDVRLADLGEVEDSWEEPRQRARLDGREVVAFSVYRATGSSEVGAAEAVREAVSSLALSHPDIAFAEVTSSSDFVIESYDAAIEALWIGALLAIGVVWLFLRDIRATLVSATALPLSLIPTFAVLSLFDISLNNITLLALSLVVGLLVDDAIVEIENIVRHMRQSGKGSYDSAMAAADEIGLAVVATTATIIAIFVPVAFMPGIPGKFFKDFAVATCVSVAFSLLVARMLTPLMSAYLVKSGGHRDDKPAWLPTYLWILKGALRHRWITLFAGFAFFLGSIMLAGLLPTEFMPATDRSRTILSVSLPPGSTLEDTDRVVLQIVDALKDELEVESIFASEGTSTSAGAGPGSSSSSASVTSARVTINLVPRGERAASQGEFETRISAKLAAIPGARIQAGGGGFSGAKVSVTLVGDKPDTLTEASDALLGQMRGVSGLLNPTSTASAARPEIIITPDKARAAEAGVTATAIASTISIATMGDADANLAKFNLGDRQIPIIVSLTDAAIGDPQKIALLPLTGSKATVPLGSVADIGYGSGPASIRRVDRQQSATIEAQLSGLALGEAAAKIAQLPIMKDLPAGVSEVKQGDQARLQELVSGFILAIVSGILLMYATLVLLFRGFIHPITILVALPLAVGGALGLLVVTGSSLAISAFIGLLMLMGIAAKNSILLVEYAIVARRDRGLSRADALLDAAAKRARPIIMTSMAMALGMLPIALGFGADAESRAPMAIAVIGGLISSTLLSLVYVPVVFTFMDDLQNLLGRVLGRLLVRDEPAAAPAQPIQG